VVSIALVEDLTVCVSKKPDPRHCLARTILARQIPCHGVHRLSCYGASVRLARFLEDGDNYYGSRSKTVKIDLQLYIQSVSARISRVATWKVQVGREWNPCDALRLSRLQLFNAGATGTEMNARWQAALIITRTYTLWRTEKPLAPAVPVQRPSRRVPGAFDGTTTSRGKYKIVLCVPPSRRLGLHYVLRVARCLSVCLSICPALACSSSKLKVVLQRTFLISTNERLMYKFYKNCNYFIFK